MDILFLLVVYCRSRGCRGGWPRRCFSVGGCYLKAWCKVAEIKRARSRSAMIIREGQRGQSRSVTPYLNLRRRTSSFCSFSGPSTAMSPCLNLSNSRDHKSSRRSSPLLAPKVRLDGESRKGETRVVAAANALCRREPRGNEHNATLPKEQPSWRGLQRGASKYFSLRGHGPYDAKKSFEWLLREGSTEGGDIGGVCGDG
jgi:hypothetical protein